ncbi:MAG: deoxyguanosinetriphosphate triphosphohydrolase [Anaerovoracaceae bacterium]|jgi:dGTPase
MIGRTDIEKYEDERLSEFACRASESKGRRVEEPQCEYRTVFQRDRDRIIHSKSFRRLMHKTQVFLSPEGDHYRTRLTHTLEVAQISRTAARALALNEDLTEAVSLGHDLGHTPFGHTGEKILDSIHPGGFRHNVQSLRVVDLLEEHNGKRGMNLTYEVRDGILNHTGDDLPYTLEGQIVRICDRIAYINHDIDDAIRAGVIKDEDLPVSSVRTLGRTHSERINTLVGDLIRESDGKDRIAMSAAAYGEMDKLRDFMFEHVYLDPEVKKEEDLIRAEEIIVSLYNYYLKRPERLPEEFRAMMTEFDTNTLVKDFVAGMTDRYAINLYQKIFRPERRRARREERRKKFFGPGK